ncbi:MAG: hypothetical protein K1W34_06740 [Lachnospiraceae bacterium]
MICSEWGWLDGRGRVSPQEPIRYSAARRPATVRELSRRQGPTGQSGRCLTQTGQRSGELIVNCG